MRYLVRHFLASGLILGCSVSEVGSMDPVDGGPCDTAMETKTLADGCTECSCDGETWSCDDDGCNTAECAPGDTKLGEGGCYRCGCDETGHWVCPTIDCEQRCTPGEMSSSPCLSCVCNAQGTSWSCTGFFDGVGCPVQRCTPGDSYTADDGCNICTCREDGVFQCTEMDCQGTCTTGRASCDGDPTNGCETDITSSVENCGACGLICMAAPQETAVCMNGQCQRVGGPTSCTYRGVDYPIGESFPSRDGCNTCACVQVGMGVEIACTDRACMCSPTAEEHFRDYISTSTEECTIIDYVCPDFTTMFGNECGCGCEQGVECPDTLTCTANTMGCSELQMRCPYSEIVEI